MRSVSKQGQLQPRCHSEARSLVYFKFKISGCNIKKGQFIRFLSYLLWFNRLLFYSSDYVKNFLWTIWLVNCKYHKCTNSVQNFAIRAGKIDKTLFRKLKKIGRIVCRDKKYHSQEREVWMELCNSLPIIGGCENYTRSDIFTIINKIWFVISRTEVNHTTRVICIKALLFDKSMFCFIHKRSAKRSIKL